MKKVFLLIAMTTLVFACGNNVSKSKDNEKVRTECIKHYEGKICCKDGQKCLGKKACEKKCKACEKECEECPKNEECGEKKQKL
ncbi:MAG: hypothetical protein FWE63_07300 [Bacteroidales bacterium]|nr:hypothetical protein [Bacteroidales bacterium]